MGGQVGHVGQATQQGQANGVQAGEEIGGHYGEEIVTIQEGMDVGDLANF